MTRAMMIQTDGSIKKVSSAASLQDSRHDHQLATTLTAPTSDESQSGSAQSSNDQQKRQRQRELESVNYPSVNVGRSSRWQRKTPLDERTSSSIMETGGCAGSGTSKRSDDDDDDDDNNGYQIDINRSSSGRTDSNNVPATILPRAKTLEDIQTKRKMVAEAQKRSGPMTRKHRILFGIKFIAFPVALITTLFLATLYLYFGEDGYDDSNGESTLIDYQLQQVLPGRLVELSGNGNIVAIRDDFDRIQAYQRIVQSNNDTDVNINAQKSIDEETIISWIPVGQTLNVIGSVELSANGTTIAYIDGNTQRPQIRALGQNNTLWSKTNPPAVAGNKVAMDSSGNLMTVGFWDQQREDVLVTYQLNGTEWVENFNRLYIDNIQSFHLSPTGEYLVAISNSNASSSKVSLYRQTQSDNMVLRWEQTLSNSIDVDDEITFTALAESRFVITTPQYSQVYGYSGRTWGQRLTPSKKNATALSSAALSNNGRMLALASISNTSTSGSVGFFAFPDDLDTTDAWISDSEYPRLQTLNSLSKSNPLVDEKGMRASYFGKRIAMDESGTQIIIQSGRSGQENVHFYSLLRT